MIIVDLEYWHIFPNKKFSNKKFMATLFPEYNMFPTTDIFQVTDNSINDIRLLKIHEQF